MDLKELNKKLQEALDIMEDINNPYTVQELSLDTKQCINELQTGLDELEQQDDDLDGPVKVMLNACNVLVDKLKLFLQDGEELRAAGLIETIDEAQIENAPFNEGKIVKSDMLNFGIGINPTKDGFVLGTISYGNQIQPFRKEGATQEEVIDVVNRVASIVENHIDDIEYAIGRIGENFGFRK